MNVCVWLCVRVDLIFTLAYVAFELHCFQYCWKVLELLCLGLLLLLLLLFNIILPGMEVVDLASVRLYQLAGVFYM